MAEMNTNCLRSRKTESLKNMLNMNAIIKSQDSSDVQWKILIYDKFGQDIISPLLNVKQLQAHGVTLHLNLHSDREAIGDVPAIYFVSPTKENLARIYQDFNKGLYESYFLNFISPITRHSLEDLAQSAITSNCVQQISKVVDQYDNYICLEENLFVLQHQKSDDISYYAVNKGSATEREMETLVASIVDGLFSVFVTLRQIPIIRAQRGTAAEMVAERLEKKIRDNLRDTRNSLFSAVGGGSGLEPGITFTRPLLVLVDRNLDLATPLHHTWTYQALLHDVLKFTLNRVTVDTGVGSGPTAHSKSRTYDLGASDSFWVREKGSPFPVVAESVESELDKYRAAEAKLKSLKDGLDEGGGEIDEMALSNTTSEITSAIDSLPELLARKQLLDLHTTVATALLEHIKARHLDEFFELEERLMSKQSLGAAQDRVLMDKISDPEMGSCEDKMRLFLIALICGPTMTDSEFEQHCNALQNAGCEDLACVQYVRRWMNFSNNARNNAAAVADGGGTTTKSMFSKLMQQGSTLVMEGVKNLVVKRTNLPVTRVTESLMEHRPTTETQDFLYLDPKLPQRSVPDGDSARNRTPFQEAVVFVVGGGNYIEYQNLLDWKKAKSSGGSVASAVPGSLGMGAGSQGAPKRNITYGCTQLYNANQFLEQLSRLGSDFK